MDIRLIDFFGVALGSESKINSKKLNSDAIQFGYIIHPDCCTESIKDWLYTKYVNFNSTFYRTWEDITSKNRLELAIDQAINYAITYGCGGVYTENNSDFSAIPDIRKYKTILPITEEELFIKCRDVLYSGIALKYDTLSALCDYICDNYNNYDFSINSVKNKEAICYLIDKLNILPSDKFTLLRYIYYKVTGETQIIKDKYILSKVTHGKCFDLTTLPEDSLKSLSSIFFRYKPLFLGLGHQSKSNKKIINKIRRSANKNHTPFSSGFWETIINHPVSLREIDHRLREDQPSNFKLIRLIQSIRENRLKIGQIDDVYSMYTIRNGKIWFKKEGEMPALSQKYDWWDTLEDILYNELVDRLKEKATSVKFPQYLKLSCPSSEKNFIGNIPFGSSFDLDKHNMIGIYWRDEWGTRDFDLSFVGYDGTKIGWNASYYGINKGLVYSGDMTQANPEASEVIYMSDMCPNGMIKVNRYYGVPGSKFIMSVSQNEIENLPVNYMVDPNTIKFQTEIQSIDAESFIGFVNNKVLYLCDFKTGDSQVSSVMTSEQYGQVLSRKTKTFIDLRQLLLDAGFKEYKRYLKSNPVELDLTDPKKDILIKLFS